MSVRDKPLSDREFRDLVDLTDNSGGSASDTIAAATNIASLTDNSGGTADDTIEAVSGSGADAAVNNNFAELADELAAQRALNSVLIDAVASLSAKVNELHDDLVRG